MLEGGKALVGELDECPVQDVAIRVDTQAGAADENAQGAVEIVAFVQLFRSLFFKTTKAGIGLVELEFEAVDVVV